MVEEFHSGFPRDCLLQYPDLRSLPSFRRIRNNATVDALRRAVAFDNVSIGGLDLAGYEFGTGKSIVSDLPPLFVETYFARGFASQDPVVKHVKSGIISVTSDATTSASLTCDDLSVLFREFGINSRAVFPVKRQATVFGCVMFSRSAPFSSEETDFLSFVAHPLHEIISGPVMERFAAMELELSPGEILCLRLAEAGLTSAEIAAEEGYSAQTVNGLFLSAARKLGATNRTRTVAIAVRRGLLDRS